MSDFNASDRDVDRAIRSWLHLDRHEDASRVAGAVLDQLDTTHQRRSWWPAWRFADMNTYAKLLVATAAVVVVAVLGFSLLPSVGSGPGSAQPSPSPSPTPTPSVAPSSAVAWLPVAGQIPAGTYRVPGSSILITLPAGWDVSEDGDIRKNRDSPTELVVSIWRPDIAVYEDACANDVVPPRTGPTVDDLLVALRAQKSSDVSEPVDVTVGGIAASRIEVSVPEGLDLGSCFEGILRIWTGSTGGNYLAFGEDPTGRYTATPVYLAQTPSGRDVFSFGHGPDATAADIAELDAVVGSIRIETEP
jgi:hypothetical protein